MEKTNELLDAALEYVAKGYSVIPVQPRGKTPLVPWSDFMTRKATEAEVREWWSKTPAANIGIVCGNISGGLAVIDIDPRNGGNESVRERELPAGPVVVTGGDGRHVYAKAPGVRKGRPVPGVDLQAEGAFVVAPPSIHPSGGIYRWENGRELNGSLPELPMWAIPASPCTKKPEAAPIEIMRLLDGVEEGARNDSAARIAGWVCRLAPSYRVGWEFMRLWNDRNRPPLDEQELRGVFTSIRSRHGLDAMASEDEAEEVPELFTRPLSELFAATEAKTKWLVENLVEEGAIGFIGGDPKQTKSWLALHIAHALATGNPVLSRFGVPEKRRVLYLQEEDSQRLVRTRLAQLMEGHGLPQPEDAYFRYSVRCGFKVDSPKWLARLRRECEEYKPQLIIADVLNKLHGQDENSQQGMSVVMRGFEQIRREFNVTILIVHHFRKNGSDRGNQMLRGSSVLSGWSENSLYVKRAAQGLYSVEFESKSTALPAFRYQFIQKPWQTALSAIELKYSGEDSGGVPLDESGLLFEKVQAQYAATMATGCTAKQLAKVMDWSENTVRKYARLLVENGQLRRERVRVAGQETEAFVPTDREEAAI